MSSHGRIRIILCKYKRSRELLTRSKKGITESFSLCQVSRLCLLRHQAQRTLPSLGAFSPQGHQYYKGSLEYTQQLRDSNEIYLNGVTYSSTVLVVKKPLYYVSITIPIIQPSPVFLRPRSYVEACWLVLVHFAWLAYPPSILVAVTIFRKTLW